MVFVAAMYGTQFFGNKNKIKMWLLGLGEGRMKFQLQNNKKI